MIWGMCKSANCHASHPNTSIHGAWLTINFKYSHHTSVFMFVHVAVKHGSTSEITKRYSNSHFRAAVKNKNNSYKSSISTTKFSSLSNPIAQLTEMALRDHFRPPLSTRRHWHSFHNAWSTYIADDLNQSLPEGYFAEPSAQFGIEIDVAAFSEKISVNPRQTVEHLEWMPSSPTATVPFQLTIDVVEVQIFSTQAGPTLVGAIELISPSNKDRPAQREAFTSKCQTYLQQGIGLIIVDIVTTMSANLHNELMNRLNLAIDPLDARLYTVAYSTAQKNGTPYLNIWLEALAIEDSLPILPLFLKGGFYLPINLENTYQYTCVRQRIPE